MGVEKAAEKTYRAISDFVNAHRGYGNLVAQELIYDHKLLQSSAIDLFVDCIRAMATMDTNSITAQNQDAVNLCKRIISTVDGGSDRSGLMRLPSRCETCGDLIPDRERFCRRCDTKI